MTTNSEYLFSGGGGGAAEYQIERSVRFNSADSAYLSRTPGSAGNRKTWTWSGWVKRSKLGSGTQVPFSSTDGATGTTMVFFGVYNILGAEDAITFYTDRTGTRTVTTTSVLRDPSAWYHIVISVDTTQATATDRVKVYVNGAEQTLTGNFPLQDFETEVNRASFTHSIGRHASAVWYLSAYLADIHFIDGQALDPTSFGKFDTNGVWQPKAYSGGYGTNGFHLPFSDNGTAAALGTDTSGNGNTWTVNNISVAAGAGNDSLVDTPTNYGTDTGAGGEVRGNYATLNPLNNPNTSTLTNGNLDLTTASNGGGLVDSTIAVSSGKWYWESLATSVATSLYVGIKLASEAIVASSGLPSVLGYTAGSYAYANISGNKVANSVASSYGSSWTTNDIIGVALDLDAGTLVFYKNGVSQGIAFSGLSGAFTPAFSDGGTGTSALSANFGQRPFAYTAPSGFKALCTQNLPEPTIADGSTAMDVALYTGNNSTNAITGLGFSPDLVWIKARSSALNHVLFDTVRTRDYGLYPNLTNAEPAASAANTDLTSFNSAGFTLGGNYNFNVNDSGAPFVAWTWDAGSSTVTNNDGTITSQVRANPSAGFSIVSWTGTGADGTIGHGLGVPPVMYILKARNASSSWSVLTTVIDGSVDYLYLNTTAAAASTGGGFSIAPTSSVISLGFATGGNALNEQDIAYCFAPVEGYSAFGSYTGNGSADGPFVYTGFRPRWVLIKNTSTTASWWMHDTVRNTYNVIDLGLYANTSASEASAGFPYNSIDTLSNGFKIRNNSLAQNGNTNVIIYAAFAENPFKTSRAR